MFCPARFLRVGPIRVVRYEIQINTQSYTHISQSEHIISNYTLPAMSASSDGGTNTPAGKRREASRSPSGTY